MGAQIQQSANMRTGPQTRRRARDEAMGIVSDHKSEKRQRPNRPGPWEKQQFAHVADYMTKDKTRWFKALVSAMKIERKNADEQHGSLPIELLHIVLDFIDTRRIMMLQTDERLLSFHPDSGAIRTEQVLKQRGDRLVCVQRQLYIAYLFITQEETWLPIGRSFKGPSVIVKGQIGMNPLSSVKGVLVDSECKPLNASNMTDAMSSASMLVVYGGWNDHKRPFLQCWRWSHDQQQERLIEMPKISRPPNMSIHIVFEMTVWADRYIGLMHVDDVNSVVNLFVYDTSQAKWWPSCEYMMTTREPVDVASSERPHFTSVQYTVTDRGDMVVLARIGSSYQQVVAHLRLTERSDEIIDLPALEFEHLVMDNGHPVEDHMGMGIVAPFNDSVYILKRGGPARGRSRLMMYHTDTHRCTAAIDMPADQSENSNKNRHTKSIERNQETDRIWTGIHQGLIVEC